MDDSTLSANSDHVYRIDRFKVPETAKGEFLQRVDSINQFLRTLPSFVQDLVLEQSGGPGSFNLITIVIWDNAEAMASAKQRADERYQETGFKPAEFLKELEIEADIGSYQLQS